MPEMSHDCDLLCPFSLTDLEFARSNTARELKVYGSEKTVLYDPEKKIGVMTSKIGASKAISLGAYAYALSQIDVK